MKFGRHQECRWKGGDRGRLAERKNRKNYEETKKTLERDGFLMRTYRESLAPDRGRSGVLFHCFRGFYGAREIDFVPSKT
jgi:hypothetical protein